MEVRCMITALIAGVTVATAVMQHVKIKRLKELSDKLGKVLASQAELLTQKYISEQRIATELAKCQEALSGAMLGKTKLAAKGDLPERHEAKPRDNT